MTSMHKIIFQSALLLLCSCFAHAAGEFHTTPGGALYKDLVTGSGDTVEVGDIVTIQFINWLDKNGVKGKEIYNTRKHNESVSFVVGTDKVMPGWNEGVVGMKQGSKRLIKLPPELGYGTKGVQGVIPPNARLIFVIDLVGLEKR